MEQIVEQWEEFPIGPKDVSSELHVTMSRKGEILIGAHAFERFGKPEAALLLFDKMNSRIGLMPSHRRVANAYPMTVKSERYRHRVIRAYRFCRHHGIKVDRTIAFSEVSINEEGILILNLKTTAAIGKPPKPNK
ncbi:MAG: hypothetical protein ACKVRN_12605 [Pyrinomonadaceae bacterium]